MTFSLSIIIPLVDSQTDNYCVPGMKHLKAGTSTVPVPVPILLYIQRAAKLFGQSCLFHSSSTKNKSGDGLIERPENSDSSRLSISFMTSC